MIIKCYTILVLILVSLTNLLATGPGKRDYVTPPYENSHFKTIDKISIHYRILEPDETPRGNIVFIHGFAASTFSWRKNMDFFAEQGYRVVAIDMPGYGYSEKERAFDHSHESRADFVWKFLDSVLPGQSWIIVGHSMGGGTAGYMAAMNPENTEKLVMVSGVFGRMHQTLGRAVGGYLLRFPVFFHLIEGVGKNVYINYERFEPLLSSAYGETADSCAVKGYVDPFKLEGSAVAVIETFMRGFDEIEPDLDNLNMPVLLLWGGEDTWVPVDLAHNLHPRIPGSKLEIIHDAGHNPMETHPKEFNQRVLEFINN